MFVWRSFFCVSFTYVPVGHSWTQCPSSSKTSVIVLQAIQSVGCGPLHCVHDGWHRRFSLVLLSIKYGLPSCFSQRWVSGI